MSDATPRDDESLLWRVDTACDRFEAAWREGRRPRIEDYLDEATGPDRAALLRELVPLDVSYRRRDGDRPTRQEYRHRFPDQAAAIDAACAASSPGPPDDARAHPGGPRTCADSNLLFGILAMQLDFITRESLVAAMHAWVLEKAKPLGRILVEQGALGDARLKLLEALVREHLKQHGDDLRQSLATLGPLGPVRRDLEGVADAGLTASLARACASRPAEDPCATAAPTVGKPTSSGQRFQILRPHARGGLGAVFVAHDQELNREVALKEIQDHHADHPESRTRFVREAEITGGLEHPGIVPVYGLGRYPDGRPFYAMRFIRGNSLKDEIPRFHAEDGAGRDPGGRAVALRALLGRFLDVCNAIDYAHSRGVLHRDLKPGNIMLGPFGETLVVDWGLAKPLVGPGGGPAPTDEKPLVPASGSGFAGTLAGSALGTPQYMSPEQAAGDLDRVGPASDVYSLGATLYHLLTGRVPFAGSSADRVLERVGCGDFPPPGRVRPGIDPALGAICLKAMALESQGRYASPRRLADDLEHWLADEPVAAYREPWGRRLARWTRRHRAWTQAGAAAVLAIALVSTAAAISIRLAWDAETVLETKEARRLAAVRADGEALVLAGQAAVARQDWAEARRALSTAIAKIGPETELEALEALATPLLAEADRQLAGRDAAQTARETYQQFRQRHDEALFHATQFLDRDPAASREATKVAIGAALALLGVTEEGAGGPALAHPFLDGRRAEITAVCYELLLLWAEAEAPTPVVGADGGPRAPVQHALRILDRAARLGPTTWAYHLQRAECLARLGDEPGAREERRRASPESAGPFDHFLLGLMHHFQGDPAAALPCFQRALGLRPDDFWAQYHTAICLLKLDRPEEARAHLTACISRRPDFLWSYVVRGYAFGELGELEPAEADFRTALGLGPDVPAHYAILVNRGRMRLLRGRLEGAHADLETAIDLLPERHEAYVNRAQAYRAQRRWDEAEAQLEQALRRAPDLAAPYRDRARIRIGRGEPAAALGDLEQAIDREAARPRDLAEDQIDRGLILHRARRLEEAVGAYDAALAAQPVLARAHRLRAEALLELGRDREALVALDRSLECGVPDAGAFLIRGLLRQHLGQTAGAVEDLTRALGDGPDSPNARTKRGWAYLLEGRKLALRDFDRALEQNPTNSDALTGRGYALALLGRHREGVEAAEQAVRFAPAVPDLLYNAACVYAQAVGGAGADRGEGEDQALARSYGQRCSALIRQALELKSPEERSSFWRDVIARDSALDPIRRTEGFARLEVEYGHPAP